jgi:drug/metabolite transporter (DMT)-like permease
MSSFALSVPFAVGAACVYGTSIVFQHRSVQEHADSEANASHLLLLLKNPTWVIAVLGDFIGFVLNAAALSIGKVVYVQPFVVLMLPIALLVHWALGGTAPRRGDVLGCLAIIAALTVFLTLVGAPHHQRVPHPLGVIVAVGSVLAAGALLCLAVARAGPRLRGAVYGGVAGAWFGTIAVMIDATSDILGGGGPHHHRTTHHGLRELRDDVQHGVQGLFGTERGLVVVAAIVLLGTGGIILTQVSFQVGALAATLPSNMVVDPLFGVLLGALLLHELIPVSPWHLVAYVLCIGLILAGGIRLAAPAIEPVPDHGAAHTDALPQ